MLATVEKVLYPKPNQSSSNGFTIISFVCNTHLKDYELACDKDGEDLFGKPFKAKGYYLPTARGIQFEINGTWEKSQRFGNTLVVSEINENITKNEVGIMSYLTSGLIKGLGFKTARAIYKKFGDETLDIMDTAPEKLKEVPGIKDKKLEQIITSYTAYRGAKGVVSVLTPLGVSANKAVKIYSKYKDDAARICRENPFKLYLGGVLSFRLCDALSQTFGLPDYAPERCVAAMYHVLKQAENGGTLFRQSSGHLCVPYQEWMEKSMQLLSSPSVNFNMLQDIAGKMAQSNRVVFCQHPVTGVFYVYREKTYEAEKGVADAIISLTSSSVVEKYDIEDEIRKMELEVGFRLAPEQKNAVMTGLKNYFSIITGGPGTGKTTIINFIQTIFAKNNPGKKILLCAPTGRAARRMGETTGRKAYTVHKALNLQANDSGVYDDVEPLDYDLIIADETSMLDVFLAKTFLKAIKKGTQVILIGDVNQLPSVGPGAVLNDIIESRRVRVAKLTKVYRQDSESLIALNSLLMCKGKYDLDYGPDFVFIPAYNWEEAARKMQAEYLKAVEEVGIDEVSMLSPFRSSKTPTGVDSLNISIQDIINPPAPNIKAEISAFGKKFRVYDRVMQTKTDDEADVTNGDIGTITAIIGHGEDATIVIDFGDDRVVNYSTSDLETVDLAYATTVHKSQGSEYKIVVFNIMEGHSIMLKRNLVYTAVTRAKKKVIIVGEKTALIKAICNGVDDTDKRNTMLSYRLINK